ncbi:hypothetical protein FKM82_020841 [Ascaphus truei]
MEESFKNPCGVGLRQSDGARRCHRTLLGGLQTQALCPRRDDSTQEGQLNAQSHSCEFHYTALKMVSRVSFTERVTAAAQTTAGANIKSHNRKRGKHKRTH